MAELLILALIEDESPRRRIPRNRFCLPRCKAFDLSNECFKSNFRISKRMAVKLIEELTPYICPKTNRKNALSTEIKVLCALNFYAFGCYQKKIGNDFHLMVSQSSVSKCIKEVSEAMSKYLLLKYVSFPYDQRTQQALREDFFEYCGLGGVLGAIDCTHVAIIAPPNDGFHLEKNYVNRKGWHSMNVQLHIDTPETDVLPLEGDVKILWQPHWKGKGVLGNLASEKHRESYEARAGRRLARDTGVELFLNVFLYYF